VKKFATKKLEINVASAEEGEATENFLVMYRMN
jgi:hypothetical protein